MSEQTPMSTSIFRVESPKSDLWSNKKLFQVGVKGDKHSKQWQSSAEVILVPWNHNEKHLPLF